jgi:ABC-type uncharacterized transport system involved in gliding motility auxiliary subunit
MEGLMMKKFTKSFWWIGLALLAFELFFYLARATWDIVDWVILGVGTAWLIVAVIFNFSDLREKVITRSARYGLNMFLMIVIVLGIIVFVDVLTAKHSKRFDLTEGKRFTLSEQTQKVLKALENKVEILCFYTAGASNRIQMEDLLSQYKYYTDRLTYRFIDPDRNPAEAKKYEIKYDGTAVVIYGGKNEKVVGSSEEDLTNALVKITRKQQKTIYFLKGHGEKEIDNAEGFGLSSLKTELEKQQYQVKDIALAQEKLPEDCNLLIIAGPQTDPFEAERKIIEGYLMNGGKALFMFEPFSTPELIGIVNNLGFDVGNNVIVEPVSRIFGGDLHIPVVLKYEEHDITKGLNVMSFYPLARSVQVKQNLPEGVTAQGLASTSPQSWGETDEKALSQGMVNRDEGVDVMGPLTIAAAAIIDIDKFGKEAKEEKEEEEKIGEETETAVNKKARIVVFGDSDFASNAYFHQQGNSDILLNSINWLAQEEDLISIRPKDVKSTPITLTLTQGRIIFWLPVVILPAAVLLVGFYSIISRRRKG